MDEMGAAGMDTSNYLTKIALRNPDIYPIESAADGIGYAVDDEKRTIAIVRGPGNAVILTKKLALAACEELKNIIELYKIK